MSSGTPPALLSAVLRWNLDSGYYAACSALKTQSGALEIAANNIANASTAGQLKTTGVENLFSPTSAMSLTEKRQAATSSSMTSLAGRVVAVLPGALVIEAERQLTMNNERQTLLLRGMVRLGDIGPNNAVSSNVIANLQLELKGKGVISEGNRPLNPILRLILRILNS